MKILITPKSFRQSGNRAFDILRAEGFDIVENLTGKTLSEEQMIEYCADVDGVIVGIDPMTEKVLKSAKNLKAISKYGVGLDNIDLKTAEKLGIKVEKAAGTNSVSVAELAIGLFFALARNIPAISNITKKGGWDRIRGTELAGKTVGIVGFGSIGKEVARIAAGIGMSVLIYDPYVNPCDEGTAEFCAGISARITSLEKVITDSDFITLHAPLNDETRHMINKERLLKMKPTAYLVNTARGGLVDEDALYEALKNNRIAGAAQDVLSKEPPVDCKLLKLDNFILTSHIGGYTAEAIERMAVKSAENLVKMLKY